MSIRKQLFKEFWFPSLVAIIWSAINYFSADSQGWSFTKVMNIAAPTFFFVSWLTAQYFRVRKQEHVSTSLSHIEGRVDSVLGRIEKQASEIEYIAKSSFYQTFDDCLYRLRESKEELADISRTLKITGDIEVHLFSLNYRNPFYTVRRELDKTIGYAKHALQAGLQDEDRFTRLSYHVEELSGHITTFIGRLNHKSHQWKTERSIMLVLEIASKVEYFGQSLLPYSKYATHTYKGSINLENLLNSHVKKIRELCDK